MREIKFRAWNSDNKLVPQEGLQWNGVNFISGIWNHEETEIVSEECVPLIEQFTGLTDRNGKEIYEGDGLEDEYGNFFGFVIFEDGCFTLNDDSLIWKLRENKLTVSGNIHEDK